MAVAEDVYKSLRIHRTTVSAHGPDARGAVGRNRRML
jgi:hypothetical protein